MDSLFDVAIIGGGINGTAIAADASQRGLSVALFEKSDLASETSSSSTKLIHGGLRYLEYGEFSLVKKSLQERKRLLSLVPYLISPLPMVLPYVPSLRPSWLLRAGLFLYDCLGGLNNLPKSKRITREKQAHYFSPLKKFLHKGFLLHECSTDDARLTVLNALQAKQHGANIHTRSEVTAAVVKDKIWQLSVKTLEQTKTVQARVVINAAGPWVLTLDKLLNISSAHELALIKGSHLVVPKLYQGEQAYVLQHDDKRIIFVIPFHSFTLIGTTDVPYHEGFEKPSMSVEERDYLLTLVNKYFNQSITASDIISSWAGLRTLLKQDQKAAQALSREYAFEFTSLPAPALSIYSGKITSYRQLATEAVDRLKEVFPTLPASNTHNQPLPGAYWGKLPFKDYQSKALQQYAWLQSELVYRLLNTYGCNTELILEDCKHLEDLGLHFGNGLYQREVDYLVQHEWASSTDDILWRRTKLGLSFSKAEKAELSCYLQLACRI